MTVLKKLAATLALLVPPRPDWRLIPDAARPNDPRLRDLFRVPFPVVCCDATGPRPQAGGSRR